MANINDLMKEAKRLYEAGEFSRVISIYDHILDINPEYAGAFNNRGLAKAKLGRYEDAIEDYDAAINLNYEYADAYNNRGNAKAKLGRYEDAITDYDEAIRLNSENAQAFYNRGNAKNNLGQHAEAIKDYDEAIQLNSENDEAWNNRGVAKADLGRYENAITDYNVAIDFNPEHAGAYNNRGNAKANLGDFEDAIKDLDQAFKLDPDNAEIVNNRAAIKAEYEARKTVEERIGSLDNTIRDITVVEAELEKDYRKARSQRDNIAVILVVIITTLSLIFLGAFDLNTTTLKGWAIATFTISTPLLIFLHLISRDTEELKILRYDYLKMKAIEARIDAYQAIMPDEQHVKLIEKQLDNWMHNSPSATLLRLKGKGGETASVHPVQDILNKCREMIHKETSKDKVISPD